MTNNFRFTPSAPKTAKREIRAAMARSTPAVSQLLLEEYAASGRTFVISTHIIEEAADILEEVIILHDGKVILEGDTQGQKASPISAPSPYPNPRSRWRRCAGTPWLSWLPVRSPHWRSVPAPGRGQEPGHLKRGITEHDRRENGMSLICEKIVKTYSGKEVLHDVSLE